MVIKLSIVIVNWETEDLIVECLKKVYQFCSDITIEVIVIDNNSKDNSVSNIKRDYPDVFLIKNTQNIGPVAANNQGLKQAQGEFIMLLNSDAFLKKFIFSEIFQYFENNASIGIIGAQLFNQDGSIQDNGGTFITVPNYLNGRYKFIMQWFITSIPYNKKEKISQPKNIKWVSSACMIMRSEMVDQIGVFDDKYFIFYDDMDYCKNALSKGWITCLHPDIEVIHLEGKSISSDNAKLSKVKNLKKLFRELSSINHYFKKNYNILTWLGFKISDIIASILRIIISIFKIGLLQNITYRMYLIKSEIYRSILHFRFL